MLVISNKIQSLPVFKDNKQLQFQMGARDEKSKELDEPLTIFDEELVAIEITIG